MIERNHLEKVLNYYENHVLKYFFLKRFENNESEI